MYHRRKPNYFNTTKPKLAKSELGDGRVVDDSSAIKVGNGIYNSNIYDNNTSSDSARRKEASKYCTFFIIICTISNVIPLIFHFSNYSHKDIVNEEKLDFPNNLESERLLQQTIHQNNILLNASQKDQASFPTEDDDKEQPIEQKFIDLAEQWKARAPELAASLRIGFKPSENRPFIFFHQRKAGGSTFRQFLYDAANNLGVRSWIPSCRFGPIPCAVFALPTHARFAVYGGHFRYMEAHKNFVVSDLKSFIQNKYQHHRKPFTCLITARPTIERVVSCWNYRFIQELALSPKVPHSSNMTAQQWDELLPVAFSKYNEGCNNEFIRNFGDLQDEIIINSMKPSGDEEYDLLALRELNNIFERISDCVVTTLPKCEEGLESMSFFLPWLQRNAKYDCEEKVNVGKSQNKNNLDPASEAAIKKHNFVDELIYDFIDTLFQEQLKYARKTRKKFDGRKKRRGVNALTAENQNDIETRVRNLPANSTRAMSRNNRGKKVTQKVDNLRTEQVNKPPQQSPAKDKDDDDDVEIPAQVTNDAPEEDANETHNDQNDQDDEDVTENTDEQDEQESTETKKKEEENDDIPIKEKVENVSEEDAIAEMSDMDTDAMESVNEIDKQSVDRIVTESHEKIVTMKSLGTTTSSSGNTDDANSTGNGQLLNSERISQAETNIQDA